MSKKIILVFAILIFYLGIIIVSDFEKFSSNMLQFKIEYLGIVLALNFSVLVIKGFRQHNILKKLGINVSNKDNLMLYFAGLSMLVTPGGTGQIIKSYFLKNKFGIEISKSFPLVFVERYNDLIAIMTIVTTILVIIQNYKLLLAVSVIWVIIILIYFIFRWNKVYIKIESIFTKINFLKKRIDGFSKSYKGLQTTTSKKMMIENWMFSIVAWCIDAISVYLIFLGFNQNLDLIYTTFVMYTSLLIGFITFLPAGLGVTELSVIGLLTSKGIEISLVTSIIIMIRLTSIWFATIIGLLTTKIFLKDSFSSKHNSEST